MTEQDSPRISRTDAPVLALLGLLGAAVPLVVQRTLQLPAPGGNDPGLWELAAMEVGAGSPSPTAPLYPALVSAWRVLSGGSVVDAAAWISHISYALLAPVVYLLARRLGAPRAVAAVAGVAALASPRVASFSVQAQADALATLVLTLCALAAVAMLTRPSWGALAGLALAAGAVTMAREHLFPCAGLLLLVALLARGRPWERGIRGLVLVVVVLLAPLAARQPAGPPWEQPWFQHRLGEAVQAVSAQGAPSHMMGPGKESMREFHEAHDQGDRLTLAWLNAGRSLSGCWPCWAWIGLGLLAIPALRRRSRWAPLVALLPVMSALVVWSQSRHVGVAVPVGVAALAGAVRRWRPVPVLLGAAGLVTVCAVCFEWRDVAPKLRLHAKLRHELRAFGEALCARLEPGVMAAASNSRDLTYCPLPRAPLAARTPLAWKLVVLGDLPSKTPDWPELEAAGWGALDLGSEFAAVYRLKPELEGDERPCADSVPVGGISYLRASRIRDLELSPPCAVPSMEGVTDQIGPRHRPRR